MAYDVFISHSTGNKAAADAACATLEARGIRCWIAPRDIRAGQSWAAAIVEAIEKTPIFLLVFSSDAKNSIQVRREVAQAANAGKQLLTLRIEDVLPEREFKYYLDEPHWLDAITPPFENHLDKLADACASLLTWLDSDDATKSTERDAVYALLQSPPAAGGRRRRSWSRSRRRSLTVAAIATVAVIAAVALGVQLTKTTPEQPPSSPTSAAPPPVVPAAPLPPSTNGPASANPRAQIVELTGSWSNQGFVDAIVTRDTHIVTLYLQSGLTAATLHGGASAILYGFQGVPQNGDVVALLKSFQDNGFELDARLEDNSLMHRIQHLFPLPFEGPLAPEGYLGGYGDYDKFVGSLLFWIVQRALATSTTEDDLSAIDYLVTQGADCTVPLAFIEFNDDVLSGLAEASYSKLKPMMQACAR